MTARLQPRSKGLLKILEFVLFFTGAAGIGVFLDSVAERWGYQAYGSYQLDAERHSRPASLRGFAGYLYDGARARITGRTLVAFSPSAGTTAETQLPVAERVRADGLIGSIEIPSVNVKTLVREGVDDSTLRLAAGHVPGTALPGQSGNVAITAHRDTFFRGLRAIRTNDLIRLKTPAGDFDYQVTALETVEPTDVRVLEAHGRHELTLITCFPFTFIGHAPQRYIVHAEAVDPGDDSQPVFGPAGGSP
jgi:sortase A